MTTPDEQFRAWALAAVGATQPNWTAPQPGELLQAAGGWSVPQDIENEPIVFPSTLMGLPVVYTLNPHIQDGVYLSADEYKKQSVELFAAKAEAKLKRAGETDLLANRYMFIDGEFRNPSTFLEWCWWLRGRLDFLGSGWTLTDAIFQGVIALERIMFHRGVELTGEQWDEWDEMDDDDMDMVGVEFMHTTLRPIHGPVFFVRIVSDHENLHGHKTACYTMAQVDETRRRFARMIQDHYQSAQPDWRTEGF